MLENASGLVVELPLRGEWRALHTPADRVPSHGTDFFGQRYAYDFVRMDPSGTWYYPGGIRALARHLSVGEPADRFRCWGQPVHAAFEGRVVAARDGWPDRRRVLLPWELVRVHFAASGPFREGDFRPLAGNFVIVEGADAVALYAHLRRGSVRVAKGDPVSEGAVLGTVGNSGNSTMPHLHFQLMDGPDPTEAAGLPCAFRSYERWTGRDWRPVWNGMPGALERIRSA